MGAAKGGSPLERLAAAVGASAAAAAVVQYATLLLWLGLLHVNTLATVVAVAWLPHPAAAAVLAVLVAAALLPVERPFAPWQKRLARHISETAHAYFPISMTCEDPAAFEAATDKFVIGAVCHRRASRRRPHAGAQGWNRTACCRSRPSHFTTSARCFRRRLRRGRGRDWPARRCFACRW